MGTRGEMDTAVENPRRITTPSSSSSAPKLPHLRINAPFVSKVAKSLQDGHIVLVEGQTGCGKSVRLPRLLMEESGLSPVLCAQPRRLAARAIAHRVAEELQEPLGNRVGYHIGQQRQGHRCELLFVTAGIFLEQLRTMGEKAISKYRVIVLDEVHERSVENDLILTCVKQLLLSGVKVTPRPASLD